MAAKTYSKSMVLGSGKNPEPKEVRCLTPHEVVS